jgi:hypothetical protein
MVEESRICRGRTGTQKESRVENLQTEPFGATWNRRATTMEQQHNNAVANKRLIGGKEACTALAGAKTTFIRFNRFDNQLQLVRMDFLKDLSIDKVRNLAEDA